jgi:hypothetical protein
LPCGRGTSGRPAFTVAAVVGADDEAAVGEPEAEVQPMSLRLSRKPGWPLACVSSIANTAMLQHPAPLLAAIRETAAPGATKRSPSRWFLVDTGT